TRQTLRHYFDVLRTADAIDFQQSRSIVLASSMLQGRGVATVSLRVGLSLLWKRYSDAFLFPLISAGLSLLVLVSSSQSLAIDDARPVASRSVASNAVVFTSSSGTYRTDPSYKAYKSDSSVTEILSSHESEISFVVQRTIRTEPLATAIAALSIALHAPSFFP